MVNLTKASEIPVEGVTKLTEIRGLLKSALVCLEEAITKEGDVAERGARSAAWRLADAAGLLRLAMASEGMTEGAAINEPTGRGFLLPERIDPALSGYTPEEVYDGVKLMERTGGGFAGALAETYWRADLANRAALVRMFGTTFARYARMAKAERERNAELTTTEG